MNGKQGVGQDALDIIILSSSNRGSDLFKLQHLTLLFFLLIDDGWGDILHILDGECGEGRSMGGNSIDAAPQ